MDPSDAMLGEDDWGMASPNRGLLREMYPEEDDEFEEFQSPGSGGVQELSEVGGFIGSEEPYEHTQGTPATLPLPDDHDTSISHLLEADPLTTLPLDADPDLYLDDLPDEPSTVGDRLYLKGQEMVRKKEERAMIAQHQRERDEETKLRTRPSICHHTVKRSGGDPDLFYKLQTDWLRNKNRVLENKRDREKREQEEMKREPHASTKSKKILAGKHKGPIEGWGEREQQFRAVHAERVKECGSFKPTISPAAQHLKRKGTVGDRLYGVAKQRSQTHSENPKEEHKKLSKDELDVLLSKMARRQETAQRKIEKKRVQLEQEEGRYQPEVNKRSEKILSRQGGHVPIHIRTKTKTRQSVSPEPMRARKPVTPLQDSFFSKLKTTKQKHDARIQRLQEQQDSELMRECHFRPETNKKSHELASRRDLSRGRQEPMYNGEEYITSDEHYEFAEDSPQPVGAEAAMHPQQAAVEAQRMVTQRREQGQRQGRGQEPRKNPGPGPGQGQPGDENFAEWEREWVDQQRDIEAILKMYTTTNDIFKRELTPEETPPTPAVTVTHTSSRRSTSYSRPHTQTHTPHHAPVEHQQHQEPTPPVATAPPPGGQVSELQSVLDGWRQLEDQFSTSFEKLRLR